MPGAKTIITGATLHDELSGRSLHGDLWMDGGTFIFNGVVDKRGEAAWVYGEELPKDARALIILENIYSPYNYFERRGVVVVDGTRAALTPAAQAYINGAPQ